MWQTFQRLVNVTDIDLCWVRAWREVTLPPPLFTSATSVRLSGRTSPEFVVCILGPQGHNIAKLTQLELNDVKEWAGATPALPVFAHLQDFQAYMHEHGQDHHTAHVTWRSMTGILEPLIDHCTHLTSLRLAVLGPCEEPGPDSREESLYRS
ncbi:hypothetical protein CC86DRAFT_34189 [Ophiobolus disseminans]|uniref:Uncharacterized protein n=1 Tax=Ophiobolus disseminans TaxID=1469910 RepID=A0A6A6ZYV2_9PLEO|nr:hypothetical protein CC86DRAFT_34189 [Ophiobolus disseminans]